MFKSFLCFSKYSLPIHSTLKCKEKDTTYEIVQKYYGFGSVWQHVLFMNSCQNLVVLKIIVKEHFHGRIYIFLGKRIQAKCHNYEIK